MTPDPSPFKSKPGIKRLAGALRYSVQGFSAAFRHEAAFRQELMLFVVALPLAMWLGQSLTQRVLLVGTVCLVLIVELLNSALEALADAITLEHHPLVGRAKDLGSAAVMLTLVLAAGVWIALLVNRMLA